VITIRNDRFVVPIKQEHRGNFPGMIHDQSASGSTLFIEPAGVVQMNNKIKELLADERIEINKILLELSQLVAGRADALLANKDAEIANKDELIAQLIANKDAELANKDELIAQLIAKLNTSGEND
jgi:DNA mismatch repair protein MutS2